MNWTKFERPFSPSSHDREPLVVGRLLRTEAGKTSLVGHINDLGGTCDDCLEREVFVEYSDDLLGFLGDAVLRELNALVPPT